jgi:hypothetical protein
MPDPLDALPYEIWIWCISLSIDGRLAGPLELLAVSRRWDGLLLNTPSLWSQIYIQNREDEMVFIIPSLIKLLGHKLSGHRSSAISLLEKLAEHSEWEPCTV